MTYRSLALVLLLTACFFVVSCGAGSPSGDDSSATDQQDGDADDDSNGDNADDSGLYPFDTTEDANDVESTCIVLEVRVEDAPADNILAREVVATTDRSCSLGGTVTSPGYEGVGPSSPAGTPPVTEHHLWFYGLGESSEFTYEIFHTGKPEHLLSSGVFTTAALPDWAPRTINLKDTPESTRDIWIAATALTVRPPPAPPIGGAVVLYDRTGRIRFFHEHDLESPRQAVWLAYFQILPDGRFAADNLEQFLTIGLDGKETKVFDVNLEPPYWVKMHHQQYLYEDLSGALVLLNEIGNGYQCDGFTPTAGAVGDAVAILNSTGDEVWRWSVFDHPSEIPTNVFDKAVCFVEGAFYGPETTDWTHGNVVAPVPGENAFLVSLRNNNRIVKVNSITGEIIWQLGEGLDFEWLPETHGGHMDSWFSSQHDAKMGPNGHILVFDNQVVASWSRALEIEVDETTGIARPVWEFTVPHTMAGGTVDKLSNGNTLISTGNAKTLHEVTPGQVEVWSAQLTGPIISIGRAAPYPAIWVDAE